MSAGGSYVSSSDPHGSPAEGGGGGEPRQRGPAPGAGAPTGRKELEHPEREGRGCAGRDGPSRERRPHPPIWEGHKQRRREQRRPPAGRETGIRQGSKPNGRDAKVARRRNGERPVGGTVNEVPDADANWVVV